VLRCQLLVSYLNPEKEISMCFCTVINCMDGRVQLPVITYLKQRFNVDHVDSITEPGPNLILAEQNNYVLVQSIIDRLKISIERHKSVGVAIVGHHDCAGNPSPKEEQIVQIQKAMVFLRQQIGDTKVIGLWVDQNWVVNELMLHG